MHAQNAARPAGARRRRAPKRRRLHSLVARFVNFTILIGALVYCAFALATVSKRSGPKIRSDLVNGRSNETGGRGALEEIIAGWRRFPES